MARSLDVVLGIAAAAIYLRVAYTDFTGWKISNASVLSLLALGIAGHLASGVDALVSGVAAGLLFFILNYLFWLAKMTGAGDVKLLAVTGFLVGIDRAMDLAVLLLVFSVLLLLVTTFAQYLAFMPTELSRRFAEIRNRGKVPYGVPISLAAIGVLLMRVMD